MAGQYELGSKHIECMKLANKNISEMLDMNPKDAALKMLEKTYGYLPSESQVYDDYLGMTVALEEIAKAAPTVAACLAEQITAREILKTYGNANASSVMNAGETVAVLCAEAGFTTVSDITTKAVQNSGQWTIKGTKQISSEQILSDSYLVFAQDEEGLIRVFSIPESQISLNTVNKSISYAKVTITQAVIDITVDNSYEVAVINDEMEAVQTIAKTLIAANSIGIAHSALIASIGACKEVKNSQGQAISQSQNAQFTIADMFSEIEASRMLSYYSANSIDEGKPSIKISAMAKVKASNIAAKASADSLQMLGNIGYISNSDYAAIMTSAVDNQVKGGTNRNQISKIYQYMLAKK